MTRDEEPPKRSAPQAVTTVEELKLLDEKSMIRGYTDGRNNLANWSERDRAYWHGYLNGLVDGGHERPSEAQMTLARAYVETGALGADAKQWRGA